MSKITKRQLALQCALASTFLLTSCKSPPATRIDSKGTQLITTVGDLDIQDQRDAAATLAQSLLQEQILGKDGKPSLLIISNYINNTSQQIDSDVINTKIKVILGKAKVARFISSIGADGTRNTAPDLIAAKRAKPNQLGRPQYSLTLKITSQTARAGKYRQKTYTFTMTLTDLNTSDALWVEETQITKQGAKPSLGY